MVRVKPKVPIANLFGMLEVAYNLRSFRLFEGETLVESLDDIYERIVSILARRVLDRARKGLYRSYVSEHDELPFVRGSIDLVNAALNIKRGIPSVPCRYQEHTVDVDENRLLYWTLHVVRRQSLRREQVRADLDRARRVLSGAIALQNFSPADCIGRFYHRLNDDYAPMHGLCRFILEQTGPTIQSGDRSFLPFELDMPKLFEAFVAGWLRTAGLANLIVRPQHRSRLDANFQVQINVDILLCDGVSGSPVAVLDTKYKLAERPSDDDIYQISFYARELQAKRALLVYPTLLDVPFRMIHGKDIRVESVPFDLGRPLDVSGLAFVDALTILLTELPKT
ncbi:5-methylcytosine-specific restriction enzyme subunit McrC [Bradyrhizobium huanghuaihaiense]|uniref:5-methylcytosine-specific restriction enzyme subunit McrC n=2 Tax=Bradyrhizobium huanghuaihaiense TaxID=990078 RepID=A0A562QUF8_9BRAD|nr:5-methylcytosine-specific restriction enzyme subunit McrC [Bradyrhizobium huanghuaihaiense]